MKKIIKSILFLYFVTFFSFQQVNATDEQVTLNNLEDFITYISGTDQRTAVLDYDLIITDDYYSKWIANGNKQIDMNGHSILIEKDQMLCIKSDYENGILRFFTDSCQPIFKVEGTLELYAGELSSSSTGRLIEIGNSGHIISKQTIMESSTANYEITDPAIGIHSLYDNQKVVMNIPQGTAIYGGNEETYYHMDIQAKQVIESSIEPTFSYSSIQSPQEVKGKQGVYNGNENIEKISIWEHQLVMGIGDEIGRDDNDNDQETILKAMPSYIITKENQYISVSFDTSTFDPTLDEQILIGQYHNVDEIYKKFLPPLEMKVLKNQEVPLSQFYVYYSDMDCLRDIYYSQKHSSPIINVYMPAPYINYVDDREIIYEYAYNREFQSSHRDEDMFYGQDRSTRLNGAEFGLKSGEVLYVRLKITEGLQKGYSNVLKISDQGMEYIAEPDSLWKTKDDEESLDSNKPSLGDKNEQPEDRDPNNGEHRNETSIDEPDKKEEEVIEKEDMEANIKAEEDIVVELKKNQVIIPIETAKEYREKTMVVSEINDEVIVKTITKETPDSPKEKETVIQDSTIKVIKKESQSTSYMGYVIVGCACCMSVITFIGYRKKVK